VLLLFAAPASAATVQEQALVDQLVPIAQRWWAAQGRTVDCPEGVQVDVVTDLGYAGLSDVGGCHMSLDARTLDGDIQLRPIRAAWWGRGLIRASFRNARRWDEYVCMLVLHEYGHLTGLEHQPAGIMRAWSVWGMPAPGACVDWALARRPMPWRHHHRRET